MVLVGFRVDLKTSLLGRCSKQALILLGLIEPRPMAVFVEAAELAERSLVSFELLRQSFVAIPAREEAPRMPLHEHDRWAVSAARQSRTGAGRRSTYALARSRIAPSLRCTRCGFRKRRTCDRCRRNSNPSTRGAAPRRSTRPQARAAR